MPPTVTNLIAASGSAASSYNTASISIVTGRLYTVWVEGNAASIPVPTVTGNSQTWDLILSLPWDNQGSGNTRRLAVFRCEAATTTSGALTIDWSGTTTTTVWSVQEWQGQIAGANGASAVSLGGSNNSESGATSGSVAAFVVANPESATVSGWSHRATEGATAKTGWAELSDTNLATNHCLQVQWGRNDGTASASWTSSVKWAGIALEIKADRAAAPSFAAVGAIASGTGTIAPGLPSPLAVGDLLLMVTECDGAETVTVSGWTEAPSSPQTADTGSASDTKLQVFYKIAAGGDATTTNDPGDHIVGRILSVAAGTFNASAPFNTSGGTNDTTADDSGSVPGGTTTRPNCLIVACVSHGNDPGANGAANYSSWTNSDLVSITERIDNTRTDGNGGGIGAATGVYVGPGTYGATAVTYAVNSLKGLISLAIQPRASFPACLFLGARRRRA